MDVDQKLISQLLLVYILKTQQFLKHKIVISDNSSKWVGHVLDNCVVSAVSDKQDWPLYDMQKNCVDAWNYQIYHAMLHSYTRLVFLYFVVSGGA